MNNMETNTPSKAAVFVYAKDGKIMVIDTVNSIALHPHLIEGGWKHTQTIDACLFIQNLYNQKDKIDLVKELTDLAKI